MGGGREKHQVAFEKHKKLIWRQKERKLYKFRSMLFDKLKKCNISQSYFSSGIQSFFKLLPLYKISLWLISFSFQILFTLWHLSAMCLHIKSIVDELGASSWGGGGVCLK